MSLKKNIVIRVHWFMLLIALEAMTPSHAQQISIDRGLRVEGLWCFPLVTDTLSYLFLPDRAFLSLDDKQQPQFSFIRYVNSTADDKPVSTDQSVSQAGGGGVLHFLVTYDTDEKKIKKAEEALKQQLNNEAVVLRGPIVFNEGRFALVSSILNPSDGKQERTLMAMGAAPVLQGSRIALSFEMDPQHSKLLLESFKMSTPDVSLVFDLIFSGLTDAFNAKVTVDWSEVQKNQSISGGASVYFVSADIQKVYEELRRTNAIKVEMMGEDSRMEALVTSAYTKITDMLFRRIEPEQLPPAQQGGLGSLLSGLFSNSASGAFSSSNLFGLGAHFGYKLKDIRTSGSSVLTFSSRTSTERHHYITFNIGDFYKKYGQDAGYFRTVSLDDPDFQRRDIFVGVDGALLPEFDKLINSVTVTLRKTHENGSTTLREVNITKPMVADNKEISMGYESVGDADRLAWLNYDFKTQFNFKGGKTWQTGWQQQNDAMINLFAPYERRVIKLDGDAEALKSKSVRAITIRVEYPFFGETRSNEITVKPEEDFTQQQFEITLPQGQYGYKYTLRWRMKDGSEKVTSGENDTGILFIDSLPG